MSTPCSGARDPEIGTAGEDGAVSPSGGEVGGGFSKRKMKEKFKTIPLTSSACEGDVSYFSPLLCVIVM